MCEKNKNLNILDLFETNKFVKVCAPMVRYSKLQFRNLVKLYNCDLSFTPMILADSFCQSEKARQNEFTTNLLDTPVITQFAANTPHYFVNAAYLSSPYCNGVDLNCGCPQRWAKELELGCFLLKKPELIYDIVRQCRNKISKPFTVSVKIRLLNDIQETVNLCKELEMCGVSFISVHARTSNQSTGDINKHALKLIKENCNIPIIANGGLSSLEDCVLLHEETNCDGFMVANSLLANPTLFTGSNVTTTDCVQHWLDICYNSTFTVETYEEELNNPKYTIREKPHNLTFQCFHHHLVFMLEKILTRKEKRIFNNLKRFCDVLEFIKERFHLKPQLYDPLKFRKSVALDLDFLSADKIPQNVDIENQISFRYAENDGKYFKNKISSADYNGECDWAGIFLENG